MFIHLFKENIAQLNWHIMAKLNKALKLKRDQYLEN